MKLPKISLPDFKSLRTSSYKFFSPMIRTRCLQRRAADALLQTPLPIPRPRHPLFFTLRYLSSSSPRRTSSETTPPSDAATLSPSPSPPFSTPFTPQPAPSSTSTTSPADTPQKHPRSKTPAGTPLKGLSWLKNQEPPKAWADDEYPEWLWSLLDAKKKKEAEGAGEGTGDFFCELIFPMARSKRVRCLVILRTQYYFLNTPSVLSSSLLPS